MPLARIVRGGLAACLAFSSAIACAQAVRVAHAQSFPPYAEARADGTWHQINRRWVGQ